MSFDLTTLGIHYAEPAFLFGTACQQSRSTDWQHKVSRFLAHEVARAPSNLNIHVQRILFAIKYRRVSDIYGAVLDLFIVLGDKGYALRGRMLSIARELLEEEYIRFLSNALRNQLKATDIFPGHAVSVLNRGFSAKSVQLST